MAGHLLPPSAAGHLLPPSAADHLLPPMAGHLLPPSARSNAGSPSLADDDRRERPAAHHEHQQGGLSKSKPLVPGVRPSAVGETSASTSLPAVLARVCQKYEASYELKLGEASAELIDEMTSLTVAGWAEADVRNWEDIDAERVEFERVQSEQQRRKQSSCWAFGTSHTDPATEHNEQVAKLIGALGGSTAGRRAILKAVAERHGISDPDAVEDMLHD